MARIRTIKPEFWQSESIGRLSRDARLLFLATLNMADDEGLLRWNEAYLMSQAFAYDELNPESITEWMNELVKERFIYPYTSGTPKQRLAWIVKFRKHQVINRPQSSKLPPPSLQNREVHNLIFERDDFLCHLCGEPLAEFGVVNVVGSKVGSIDHLKPKSAGGTDHPSNLKAAHLGCNKSRGNKPLNDSLNGSLTEVEVEVEVEVEIEREREREGIKNKNLSSEKLSTKSTDSASVVDNPRTESKASDPSGSDEDRGGEEKPSQEPTPESRPEPVVESAPSVEPTTVPTRGKVWGSDEDVATARWMHEQIAEVAPSIKGVNFDAWGNAIRLMRELDQHSDAEIRAMFEWANADAFWRTVILSPGTLRSKWVQLEAKRLAEQGAGSANGHRKGANGSGGRAGWWESRDGITAKGVELKLIPAAGEDWSVYKGRVVAELERRGMPVYVK